MKLSLLKKHSNRQTYILLGAFFLISFFSFCLFVYLRIEARSIQIETLKGDSEDYSELVEEILLGRIGRIESALENLAQFSKNGKVSNQQVLDRALNFQKKLISSAVDSAELSVVNSKGKVIATTIAENLGFDYSDRSFFKELSVSLSPEMIVSEPIFGKARKKWLVILARALVDEHRHFNGIVYSIVPQEYFSSIFSSARATKYNLFAISTGDPLKFLFRVPDDSKILGTPNPGVGAKLIRKKGGNRITYELMSHVDNVQRIQSSSFIGRYNMFVTNGLDVDGGLSAWRKATAQQTLILLAVNLLTLVLVLNYLKYLEFAENQKTALANSAKLASLGEMAAGVAHEINNPLTIIDGKARSLAKLLSAESYDKSTAVHDVETIRKTSERIAKIVRGLKTLSRDGSGDSKKPELLATIIEDALELCRERFKFRNIDLRVRDIAAVEIMCRQVQISQIILNLLNNSFDAIESLQNPWVEISTKVIGEKIEISVVDCGNGIPSAVVEKMLQPFFTTKGVGKGTGLGLSISSRIAQDHGGRIYYDEKSPNTRFVMELPFIISA